MLWPVVFFVCLPLAIAFGAFAGYMIRPPTTRQLDATAEVMQENLWQAEARLAEAERKLRGAKRQYEDLQKKITGAETTLETLKKNIEVMKRR